MVAISNRGQERNITSEADNKKGNKVLCQHIFDPEWQDLCTCDLEFKADWFPPSRTILGDGPMSPSFCITIPNSKWVLNQCLKNQWTKGMCLDGVHFSLCPQARMVNQAYSKSMLLWLFGGYIVFKNSLVLPDFGGTEASVKRETFSWCFLWCVNLSSHLVVSMTSSLRMGFWVFPFSTTSRETALYMISYIWHSGKGKNIRRDNRSVIARV